MSDKLLIDTSSVETRLALLRDGVLEEFHVFPANAPLVPGAPLMGRIKSIVPALEAAFVDIGEGEDAFLPLSKSALATCVEGDLVLTSLAHAGTTSRSGRSGRSGEKGARLSREISLAGRGFVLLIGGRGVHFSRQLSAEARVRLKDLVSGLKAADDDFGVIVRTEAEALEEASLSETFAALRSEAKSLQALAGKAAAPGPLLGPEANFALFVRGMGAAPVSIEVDAPELANALTTAWQGVRPDLARALKVSKSATLLAEAGVEDALEALLGGRVLLPSGGEIVVEPTEALTAIDVNTGALTQRKGASGNQASRALATNLEAADAVARVLRLANIGGLVVIDFLKVPDGGDTQKVLTRLRTAVADDASVRIGGLSKLGLCDLSRARRGPSLYDVLTSRSAGVTPSASALAARAVRLGLAAAEASPGRSILCEVAPPVLASIERLQGAAKGATMRVGEARVRYVAREDFARDRIETKAEM